MTCAHEVTNSFATTATDGMDLRHRDRCITDRLEAMPDTSQRTLAASVGLVTAGSMVANICAYLVHVPAGRWLGASAYGEFAVLMAAMLVLAVPALALQAVVARDTVHGRPVGELIRLTVLVTVVVAALMVPAVPLFMWLADTGFATTVAGLAAAPILVLIAGVQGLLQRWARLSRIGYRARRRRYSAVGASGDRARVRRWGRTALAAGRPGRLSQRAPRGSWCVRASPGCARQRTGPARGPVHSA